MQTITKEEYYLLLAYYMVSCQAQKEVRKHQAMILDILKDDNGADTLSDAIYDPLKEGTKRECDELLFQSGITVEWKKEVKSRSENQEMKDAIK
jgi:hypothetical protein